MFFRLLNRSSILRPIPTRLIRLGIQPEHIKASKTIINKQIININHQNITHRLNYNKIMVKSVKKPI